VKELALEPQDESSQIAALMCAAEPHHRIIDYCAGAGGKALALGLLLKGRGKIQAHDVNPERLKDLDHRAARLKLKNITKTARPEGLYDRFIVDAPCSGTGTGRRAPDLLKLRLSHGQMAELARVQSEILDKAAGFVASGGRIMYFTCSVLRAENEDQIAAFLDRHGDFRLAPAAKLWGEILPGKHYPHHDLDTLRLGPLSSGTDGFFIAALEKT
jgi:16S rRNA (cytosine967-C5)-methyltransferase